MILQGNDGGYDIEGLQANLKALDLTLDNSGGALRFLLAVRNVRRHCLLQVVDIVDEDSVHLVHFRVDVARHRNVNEEHGAVLAAAHEKLAMLASKDRVRSSGRGN